MYNIFFSFCLQRFMTCSACAHDLWSFYRLFHDELTVPISSFPAANLSLKLLICYFSHKYFWIYEIVKSSRHILVYIYIYFGLLFSEMRHIVTCHLSSCLRSHFGHANITFFLSFCLFAQFLLR